MAKGLRKFTVQEALAPYFKSEAVGIAVTGTSFAAVDSDPDTITDSGTGFVTAGFKAGDTISVSGSSAPANNTTHIVDTVIAGTLTLSSASSLVVDVAGDTWTITPKYDTSRAIVNETSSTLSGVVLTFEGGNTITMDVLSGVIYPLSCTATSNKSVSFL